MAAVHHAAHQAATKQAAKPAPIQYHVAVLVGGNLV